MTQEVNASTRRDYPASSSADCSCVKRTAIAHPNIATIMKLWTPTGADHGP